MTRLEKPFWQAMKAGLLRPGDKASVQLLSDAASDWEKGGKYFSAAYAMGQAIHAAWGDGQLIRSCIRRALTDYAKCVEANPPDSYESLVALLKWSEALYFPLQSSDRSQWEGLWNELAQRLFNYFKDSPHVDSYLVRGVLLKTDLEGDWESEFPEFEVHMGVSGLNRFEGFVTLNLPSAFRLFIYAGDYQGARAVIERCPQAFTTPGLRGWRAAVLGLVDSTQAPERFAEASREFAQDTLPSDDDLREGRSWSSINHDLWSKYFESRSALSMVVRDPARVRSLVVEAATAAQNNDSGWRSGIVSRYRILVQTLANLIGEEPGLTPQQAQKQFLQETEWGGEMIEDAFAQRFLILAGESFEGFQNDPAKEMTTGRLRNALDALGRIPIIGPDVADAVEPEIGAQAYNVVLGTNTTWVHRTLESIGEESLLQKILLRLLQADLPLYAQILHGPLEYGKDVVVLIEENGRNVLRMYQVKCGDITTPIWRNSRHELEEMFLVPLSDFQMPDSVDKREGILLCNGHANTYVIPAMEGWVKEQRDALGRDYRFMHLDDMVTWIINQRMINVFKSALSELGIDLAL